MKTSEPNFHGELNNRVVTTIDSPVLVLNQSYEPLNLCRTRRAIVLIFRGKAEVL